jgi:hypothetical protein
VSSFIQQSIDDGSLVLYHDYRLREARDLSDNGNHGALTDVQWTGRGARFPQSTSKITVADSPELQLVQGALAVFGDLTDGVTADDRIISKRDSGGTNYEVRLDSIPRIEFYDGSSVVNLSVSVSGKKYSGINFVQSGIPQGFIEANSVGSFDGSATISVNDADLIIGNAFSNAQPMQGALQAALIFNRPLTETEHARLYCELAAKKFPTKLVGHTDAPLWKTDYGAYETESAVTSGPIGGTPFKVQSGSFKISRDAIDGEAVKVIECVTSGSLLFPQVLDRDDTDWTGWVNTGSGYVETTLSLTSLVYAMSVGDKIAYSDIKGNHSIVKEV